MNRKTSAQWIKFCICSTYSIWSFGWQSLKIKRGMIYIWTCNDLLMYVLQKKYKQSQFHQSEREQVMTSLWTLMGQRKTCSIFCPQLMHGYVRTYVVYIKISNFSMPDRADLLRKEWTDLSNQKSQQTT